MNLRILITIAIFSVVIANVFAVVDNNLWQQQILQIGYFSLLFVLYFKKLPFGQINFIGFLVCAIAAHLTSLLADIWVFTEITLGLWMIAFIFLIIEAVKFTEYKKQNRYLHLYFAVVVAVYIYLFSLHMLEIEEKLADDFLFSMYLIYYFNLLVLGLTALVYYLNSFSRKSVYFSCLALAFIMSDVLRDMGIFYFRDVSVEVVGTVIKLAALALAFLFFITTEKKLRLLHLI